MDFASLQTCVHKRLLWINEEIRTARGLNDTDKLQRFIQHRKETDKLLSKVKEASINDPHNLEKFQELDLLYRSKSLI